MSSNYFASRIIIQRIISTTSRGAKTKQLHINLTLLQTFHRYLHFKFCLSKDSSKLTVLDSDMYLDKINLYECWHALLIQHEVTASRPLIKYYLMKSTFCVHTNIAKLFRRWIKKNIDLRKHKIWYLYLPQHWTLSNLRIFVLLFKLREPSN